MTIGNVSIIKDSTLYLRDIISGGIPDAVSGLRPEKSRFVVTDSPGRVFFPPTIVLEQFGMESASLGAAAEASQVRLQFRGTIYAKTPGERDGLTGSLFNVLERKQHDTIAASGTIQFGLYDYRFINAFNRAEPADPELKVKTCEWGYTFFTT